MRAIAIYGFSESTRAWIAGSSAKEVWTLNDAFRRGVPMERVTRWYELHREEWIRAQDEEYQNFLSAEHPFRIYMQAPSVAYPASVKYPLDLIAEIDGERYYYTNSIAYMIAHAIHERVDRIELYGVDMAEGTEYAYQKAGTEYLLGLADGMGIEIYLPPGCALLNAPLYGYDTDTQTVSAEILKQHQEHYRSKADETSPLYHLYDGAQAQIEMLLQAFVYDGRIGRQSIERQRTVSSQKFFSVNSEYNHAAGRLQALTELWVDIQDATAQSLDCYIRMMQYDGAMQASRNLLAHLNLKPYSLDLAFSLQVDR